MCECVIHLEFDSDSQDCRTQRPLIKSYQQIDVDLIFIDHTKKINMIEKLPQLLLPFISAADQTI